MTSGLIVSCPFRIKRAQHGRKGLQPADPDQQPVAERVPRVARLMALAIRFEQLLHDGVVSDQAELARLGHVTRARLTQIMNLSCLAPDLQEEILYLTSLEHGRNAITEKQLRPIVGILDWQKQRRRWLLENTTRCENGQHRKERARSSWPPFPKS